MLFRITNPIHNCLTHCGVLEFLPTSEPCCYLPHWMMHHLLLQEGDQLQVQSVTSLPTATFARFQPRSKDFLDITNPKAVLEKQLRNFSCLTKDDLISINYLDRIYELFVLELKPSDAVTIIECDMEVDFAPPTDYVEPKINKQQQVPLPSIPKNSTTFMPFHGQGNRLNGKMKTNGKEEGNQMEIPLTRGIPNYDYTYGSVQFIRVPLRSLNDISEGNPSNILPPFPGDGKILKQPQNQRPK
jgi:ubiquitin fusion degradation protein 1